VDRFVEKPPADIAEGYVRQGYLWNTGIFIWPVDLFLEEVRRHAPEIGEQFELLEQNRVREFFERVPSLSVDHAVLERSDRVGVMAATFEWDDVGAWDAVARTRPADALGNVSIGNVHLIDSRGCIVWAEDDAIVTFGAQDLVIVRAHGVTFVAPRERAPDLKRLLDQLPPSLREPGEVAR
jgi:mannose-1-phosphate guanylyltransferase